MDSKQWASVVTEYLASLDPDVPMWSVRTSYEGRSGKPSQMTTSELSDSVRYFVDTITGENHECRVEINEGRLEIVKIKRDYIQIMPAKAWNDEAIGYLRDDIEKLEAKLTHKRRELAELEALRANT